MLVTIVITTLVTIGVTTYRPTRFERVTRGRNKIKSIKANLTMNVLSIYGNQSVTGCYALPF